MLIQPKMSDSFTSALTTMISKTVINYWVIDTASGFILFGVCVWGGGVRRKKNSICLSCVDRMDKGD